MRVSKGRAPGLILTGLAVLGPSGAFAQSSLKTKSLLDEMTVTAARRMERIGDQPGNFAKLTADDIVFLRADHVAEALNRLPGVNIQRGSGQEQLTAIRSPVLTGGAGAGSFLYLEDGVPLRAPGFANVNGLMEAHTELARRIEVVRGPGSALYGSNAVHGLVNVLTPEPSAVPRRFIEALWGRFGRGRVRASLSEQKGRHGIYAGLTVLHENGFRAFSGLEQQKLSIRYAYKKGPTRLTAQVSGQNLNQETAGFIKGPDAYKNRDLARSNPNPEAFRDAKSFRALVRWEQRVSPNLELNLTPYGRWNRMDFRLHFLPGKALENNGHSSAGVQSALHWTPSRNIKIITGVDTDVTHGFLREVQAQATLGSFTQGVHYDYDVNALVFAAFVHGEWQISPALRLVGGARFEYTRYQYRNNTNADTVGRFKRPAARTDVFRAVTPKFGLVYDLTPSLQFFTNFAQGARAPQTTDLYRLQVHQNIGAISVEKLNSVEAGLRGDVWGGSFEVSGYYMKKRHFFFRDADGFNVTNGKTRHVGVEVQVSLPLTPWLELKGSAAYARHTYDFNRIVSAQASEVIRQGNDVDTAPRWTGNMRVLWRPTSDLTAELEWVHRGRYFTDAANLHTYPGHELFNVRGSWKVTQKVEVFFALRNLTNKAFATRADFAFGSARYFPGEPRALEGGMALRF